MSFIDRINKENEYEKQLKRISQKHEKLLNLVHEWEEDFESCEIAKKKGTSLYTFYSWFPYFLKMCGQFLLPFIGTFSAIFWKHAIEDEDFILDEETVSDSIIPLDATEIMAFLEKVGVEQRGAILRKLVGNVVLENKMIYAINNHNENAFVDNINLLKNPKLFLQCITLYMIIQQARTLFVENAETVFSANEIRDCVEKTYDDNGAKKSIEIICSSYIRNNSTISADFKDTPDEVSIFMDLFDNSDATDADEVEFTKGEISEYNLSPKYWKRVTDFIISLSYYFFESLSSDLNLSNTERKAIETTYDNCSDPKNMKRVIHVNGRRLGLNKLFACTDTGNNILPESREDFIDTSKLYKVKYTSLYFQLVVDSENVPYEEALIKFINGIAKLGYIEDNVETKQTFFLRFTGLSENEDLTSAKEIKWNENPILLFAFIRFFYGKRSNKYEDVNKFFIFMPEYGDIPKDLLKGRTSYMEIHDQYKEYLDLLDVTFPNIWDKNYTAVTGRKPPMRVQRALKTL